MKFVWFSISCLLIIQSTTAFKELFKPREGKPGILDILTKPKIPGVNIQLGSHFGTGSFGFGFGFGGQFRPSGNGANLPPKGTVDDKPDYPEVTSEEKKDKVGPRPNSGEDDYPNPGSHDDDKDPTNTGPFEDNKEYPGSEEKDSLPDWEDIGEKNPKSENMMDSDLVGDGLIQPRLNKRRNKRFIESRVYHVPLSFRSNGKPYKVKIHSNPNSLLKGN